MQEQCGVLITTKKGKEQRRCLSTSRQETLWFTFATPIDSSCSSRAPTDTLTHAQASPRHTHIQPIHTHAHIHTFTPHTHSEFPFDPASLASRLMSSLASTGPSPTAHLYRHSPAQLLTCIDRAQPSPSHVWEGPAQPLTCIYRSQPHPSLASTSHRGLKWPLSKMIVLSLGHRGSVCIG